MKKFLTMALALMMVLSLFAVPTMAAADGVVFSHDFEDYDNNGGTNTISSLWSRTTSVSLVTGYGDTGYALRTKMETSHQKNGLTQTYKQTMGKIPAGDYTFSAKVKATPGMANYPIEGLTIKVSLFTANNSFKQEMATPVALTKEWQTISLDFSFNEDKNTATNTISFSLIGGPQTSSINVDIDDITIAKKVEEPTLPTTATVSISGANAVTSVANETVTIGEATTFTVTPKLGYYIQSISVGGTNIDVQNAYKGGTYNTGAIEEDTAIVVTTAAIATDTSGTYSADVATLPAVFNEVGEAPVTFGKVLADVATVDEFGIYLTKGGEGVTSAKTGMGPHFKAFYNVNGQYAIEFQGLIPGEYVAKTYVKVAGETTYGIATTFTVAE